ncbi:2OG-Fe(II) oxygenase [Zopfochytrium polystomum]|nr:2OG-Fe(II) oxygenase [Zopfochytrium polystomum]
MQSYLETLAREVSPYPSVSATSSTTRFPVIDISSPDYDDVAAQIRAACEEWGAFAVIRHGVPRKVQQNLVKYGKRFFELPHEEKMKIFVGKGGVAWRGYMWKGGEYTHGSVDAKEGLYIGPDHPPTHPRVVAKTPLFGMNQCPDDSIPELRSAIATYIHHTTLLGERIMDLMSHSLGLSDDHLRRTVTLSEPIALVRLFSYPPTTSQSSDTDDGGDSSSGKTTDFGIGPHTDYGLLTMLYQDSPGLEFFHEGSGTWVSAPFPASGEEADNDFVLCNVGDVLDRLTCGRFHSPRHRVLNRNAKARLSVPFFFDPSWDAEMRPLPLGHLPPLSEADQRAAHLRWDETSILKFEGPYSSFLAKKVSKVFAAVLPEEVVAKLETTKGPSTRFQIPIPV